MTDLLERIKLDDDADNYADIKDINFADGQLQVLIDDIAVDCKFTARIDWDDDIIEGCSNIAIKLVQAYTLDDDRQPDTPIDYTINPDDMPMLKSLAEGLVCNADYNYNRIIKDYEETMAW